MSPIKADDHEVEQDIPTAKPAKSGPARLATKSTAGPVLEVGLPENVLRHDMPIVRARVVYLGAGTGHSVSMPGQVSETYIEDDDGTVEKPERIKDKETGEWVLTGKQVRYTVIKEAIANGISQYDFSTLDSRGRIITDRLMPDTAEPSKVRGRPFTWVEHVGHLRNFELARDRDNDKLYYIMARPEVIPLISDHIRKSERARRQQDALFAEVAG